MATPRTGTASPDMHSFTRNTPTTRKSLILQSCFPATAEDVVLEVRQLQPCMLCSYQALQLPGPQSYSNSSKRHIGTITAPVPLHTALQEAVQPAVLIRRRLACWCFPQEQPESESCQGSQQQLTHPHAAVAAAVGWLC
jgi:hypothetical protein